MKERILQGKTKVIATIGPSSETEEIIEQFFSLGVDVFRLNFSHGSHYDHLRRINIIRNLENKFGRKVSILQDLQGPKIRLGVFEGGSVELKEGDYFTLTKENVVGNAQIATLSYPEVIDDVNVGDEIFINDGLIKVKTIEKGENSIKTKVIQGGIVSDHKGVNFPHSKVNIKAITDKDIEDLKFGIENGVDLVALSFVRSRNDLLELKELMKGFGRVVPVVSKIEKWEAIQNIEEIIEESDAVMVARGDLGVEIPVEKVPILQKTIIKLANLKGKPVITATQMLASMVDEQFPTRAEVTDVANAIFDGSDAVMLSNETASGKNPVLSVKVMRNIINEVEKSEMFLSQTRNQKLDENVNTVQETLAMSIKDITNSLDIKLIIVATESGKTANLISKYKPTAPILALTPKESTLRYLNLKWGVFPYLVRTYKSVDEILEDAPKVAVSLGILQPNDKYLIVCGTHTGVSGTTNLIKVDVA